MKSQPEPSWMEEFDKKFWNTSPRATIRTWHCKEKSDSKVATTDDIKAFIKEVEARARREGAEEAIEEIRTWVSKNYSRSTSPIYAHIDLQDTMLFLKSRTSSSPNQE